MEFDVTVPVGRMFVPGGGNRGNSWASRFFAGEQSGTVGVVLFLAGAGLGVAALVVRRSAAAVAPPHWSPRP
ncbi:hypothetical protein ACWDZ4_06405 [Streptomyces sp. NPDC003016]